jgi:hypothetical protein
LAHPGDRIRLGEYEATVEDVRRRSISRVLLQKRPLTTAPPPPVEAQAPTEADET